MNTDVILYKYYGYSLIELIIVFLVIGILAVYPLIQWSGTTANVLAEAQLIASDIRYAQSLSMSTESCYRIVRSSATSYQITNGTTTIILPSGSTTMILNSGISFGTWIPSNLIAFDSNGIPQSDACATALSANATIPVTNGSTTNTITINQVTGMVTVS
jgi:prepilin-type N-terminal cleavage/methylation domain-containing protein